MNLQPHGTAPDAIAPVPAAAKSLAWIAFADILVFFGVLLVGFAYLWRRGDLEWVRSVAAQEPVGGTGPPLEAVASNQPAHVGHSSGGV